MKQPDSIEATTLPRIETLGQLKSIILALLTEPISEDDLLCTNIGEQATAEAIYQKGYLDFCVNFRKEIPADVRGAHIFVDLTDEEKGPFLFISPEKLYDFNLVTSLLIEEKGGPTSLLGARPEDDFGGIEKKLKDMVEVHPLNHNLDHFEKEKYNALTNLRKKAESYVRNHEFTFPERSHYSGGSKNGEVFDYLIQEGLLPPESSILTFMSLVASSSSSYGFRSKFDKSALLPNVSTEEVEALERRFDPHGIFFHNNEHQFEYDQFGDPRREDPQESYQEYLERLAAIEAALGIQFIIEDRYQHILFDTEGNAYLADNPCDRLLLQVILGLQSDLVEVAPRVYKITNTPSPILSNLVMHSGSIHLAEAKILAVPGTLDEIDTRIREVLQNPRLSRFLAHAKAVNEAGIADEIITQARRELEKVEREVLKTALTQNPSLLDDVENACFATYHYLQSDS